MAELQGPKNEVTFRFSYTVQTEPFEPLTIDMTLKVEGQGNPTDNIDRTYKLLEAKFLEKSKELQQQFKNA